MYLSRYVKIYQSPTGAGYKLIYSTKRASMALVRDVTLDAIESASLPDSQQQTLFQLGILHANPDLELQEMLHFFDRLNHVQSVFTALIVLNLDCNLACSYCYEDGIKAKQYISRDTIDGFIEYVKALDFSKIKEVVIDFYGGEPLLSFDAIVYISDRLRAAGNALGFRYSFRLVTNGTLLTQKTVEKLTDLGLKGAKVTLDGPQSRHDVTRPFTNGKGSFNRILANLMKVREMTDLQIGGNYAFHTYRDFPFLLDDLIEKGVTPDKVGLVKFDPIAETGRTFRSAPELGSGCGSLDEEWLVEASVFLREEILRRGFRTPKITPLACVVELKDDIVLYVDGSLYKCPGMLGRKEFSVGSIQDGITGDYSEAYGLYHWKNTECLQCAYLPLCFGGCRFMNMLRTGTISGTYCRRLYFDATLESFVNQEIKYKDQIISPSAPYRKQ